MKDRIVFFILGAVLATIAYFVGDMDKVEAQGGTKVFDENVAIKGILTVHGGRILVYNNTDFTKKAEDIKSMASIDVTDSEADITVSSGGIDMDKKLFGSSATLYARTIPNGQHISAVSLLGKYGRDQWQSWSAPGPTKTFLKEQLDLD